MSDIEVRVSHEIPKIYDELHEKFGVEWDDGIIITMYPKVYCKYKLTPEKIVHEAAHLERQAQMGVDVWWHNFLIDPSFRLEEELIAHRKEADFIRKYVKNREDAFQMVHRIARNLASPMYGNMVTLSEALKLIK